MNVILKLRNFLYRQIRRQKFFLFKKFDNVNRLKDAFSTLKIPEYKERPVLFDNLHHA